MSDDDRQDRPDREDREDREDAEVVIDDDPTDPGNPFEALPRGTTLGRYSILGRLDESDVDVLYAAYDADSQRKVAIKLLRVRLTEDDPDEDQALLRMAREAQRIAKLDHPCVVRVYEVGVFRDRVFMAMEFVDGIDLRHWMEARDDPFPWPEVVRIFREAGRGLAAAHKGGIVHRDFKPGNVILGKDGRICIVDFGLSRETILPGKDDARIDELRSSFPGDMIKEADDRLIERFGDAALGTPAYMAPEVHVTGKVDHRSDQFSFCVALYEALYGERPFSGNRPVALALEAVNRKVRPAPEGSDVPEWLRKVVIQGLAPLPEDRHRSMEALLRELASDPAASRRRWILGGSVVAAGVVAAIGMLQLRAAEEKVCAPDIEALEGIWDPQRRDALEEAMLASGRPWAQQTWNTIEDRVDDWANVWTGGTKLACQATFAWAVADEELYDKRRACLDRHLGEVAALSRVLEAPSPDLVDDAFAIAMELHSPRLCRDDQVLYRRVDPPEDIAERVVSLAADVDDAWAYLAAGRHNLVIRDTEALERKVEPLGYAPLLVDVLLLSGRARREIGGAEVAETTLQRAARLAVEEGLEPETAEAYLELSILLVQSGRADEAERLADFAEGLVHRLQLAHLAPTLAMTQADIAVAQGKPSVALSTYYRAIKLERDRVDGHPLRLAPIWRRLGRLLMARGDAATAKAHFDDAVDVLEQTLGPQHPLVGDSLVELASAQQALSRGAEAIAALQRAAKIRRQVGDAKALGIAELRLGDALLSGGRAHEAVVAFTSAESVLRDAALPGRVTEALYGRGLAELADGADETAAATLDLAVARLKDGSDPIALADARFALARALWITPEQQPRALALASLAERAYTAAGDQAQTEADAVRAWARAQTVGDEPPTKAETETDTETETDEETETASETETDTETETETESESEPAPTEETP